MMPSGSMLRPGEQASALPGPTWLLSAGLGSFLESPVRSGGDASLVGDADPHGRATRADRRRARRRQRVGSGRQRWRTIVAVVLIVLGCVLAPLAGVAVSVRMARIGNVEWRRSRKLGFEIACECAPGP
jgi:hypothetical protein